MANTLLVLSTATHSPAAIDHALEKAKKLQGKLLILFIADQELPKSIFERLEGTGFIGEKQGQVVHQALMDEYKRQGEQQLKDIKARADKEGVEAETILKVGDIADECIRVIREQNVAVAVLTRKRRSHLSRFIFGSPIKKIQDNVNCEFEIIDQETN